MPSNSKTSLSVLDMMGISEQRKTLQSEDIALSRVLAIFLVPIKVDGMDLAARMHLIT